MVFNPLQTSEYTSKYVIKMFYRHSFIDYLAEKIKDKDYQSSLEGLTENQKSCKEFSRLFNKYNLNTIDYEDMILSLLKIPILQSSDKY